MRILERILTGIAILVMPFIGLAATAHQIERGSPGGAILYGAVSLLVLYELIASRGTGTKTAGCTTAGEGVLTDHGSTAATCRAVPLSGGAQIP